MNHPIAIPSVSVRYAQDGSSTRANMMGMRPMQERVWLRRGVQYLLIKSPPASGKSRALMFIALDKLTNQKVKQAIIVVPEKAIGASFHDEPLSQFGFWADWKVAPQWNLCDAPGGDNGGKVDAVKRFLASGDRVLVCTHATFRFAVERYGVEAFDDRLIAVDEFHHVSANPDSRLGDHVRQLVFTAATTSCSKMADCAHSAGVESSSRRRRLSIDDNKPYLYRGERCDARVASIPPVVLAMSRNGPDQRGNVQRMIGTQHAGRWPCG